jgi:hypothetical protein
MENLKKMPKQTTAEKKIAQLEQNKKTAMMRLKQKAMAERHTIVGGLTGMGVGILENTQLGKKIPQFETFGIAGTLTIGGIFTKLVFGAKLPKEVDSAITAVIAIAAYKGGQNVGDALQRSGYGKGVPATPSVTGFDPNEVIGAPVDAPLNRMFEPSIMGVPLPEDQFEAPQGEPETFIGEDGQEYYYEDVIEGEFEEEEYEEV